MGDFAQEMCYQELQQIFGDSDRPATFADTLEMKILERCLLEALRMYPPVPIIARKLQEDVKLGEFCPHRGPYQSEETGQLGMQFQIHVVGVMGSI